jgi:hypothetical protein
MGLLQFLWLLTLVIMALVIFFWSLKEIWNAKGWFLTVVLLVLLFFTSGFLSSLASWAITILGIYFYYQRTKELKLLWWNIAAFVLGWGMYFAFGNFYFHFSF